MAISTGAAILGGAAISAGASFLSAGMQSGAAGDAAGFQLAMAREAIAEQRRQYDQNREDFAPYREIGTNALTQYAALYGIGRGNAEGSTEPEFLTERYQSGTNPVTVLEGYQTAAGDTGQEYVTTYEPVYDTRQVPNPDYQPGNAFLDADEMQAARDRFKTTPGYEFRLEEGVRALDRSAASQGRLRGGGHERELLRYGQNLGAAEFENYANRLAGLAGMGQGATATTATIGNANSANISNALLSAGAYGGNAMMAAGTARASGFAGAANAINSGVQNYLLADYLGTG